MNCPGSVGGKLATFSTTRKCSRHSGRLATTVETNCPRRPSPECVIGGRFYRKPAQEKAGVRDERARCVSTASMCQVGEKPADKKRLPEGWLLSTSGSAPRLKAVLP